MDTMSTPQTRDDDAPARLVCYLPGAMAAAFQRAASANQRSTSGELRALIAERLARHERWRGK
jgi:hypothetical protein